MFFAKMGMVISEIWCADRYPPIVFIAQMCSVLLCRLGLSVAFFCHSVADVLLAWCHDRIGVLRCLIITSSLPHWF